MSDVICGEVASINEIKRKLKNGIRITHILQVSISHPPNSKIESSIQELLFKTLNGIPSTRLVGGLPVTVTWDALTPTPTSTSFVTYNIAFTDRSIVFQTKQILCSFVYLIKNDELGETIRKMDGYNDEWAISFFLSKTLVYQVPLGGNIFNDIDGESESGAINS